MRARELLEAVSAAVWLRVVGRARGGWCSSSKGGYAGPLCSSVDAASVSMFPRRAARLLPSGAQFV